MHVTVRVTAIIAILILTFQIAGQTACVNGTMAVCKFGSWRTTSCPDSEQCFAVPSTTGLGTVG